MGLRDLINVDRQKASSCHWVVLKIIEEKIELKACELTAGV